MAPGHRRHVVPTPAEIEASSPSVDARGKKKVRAFLARKLGMKPGVGEQRTIAAAAPPAAPPSSDRGNAASHSAEPVVSQTVATTAPPAHDEVPAVVMPQRTVEQRASAQKAAPRPKIKIGDDVRAARGGKTATTSAPRAQAPQTAEESPRPGSRKLPPGASAAPQGISQYHTDVG
jgi:hypothetical protein